VPPPPPHVLGDVGEQQAHRAGLRPRVAVHVVLRAPPLVVRRELLLDELPYRSLEQRELVVHPG
jgi:hypothetical protein